MIIVEVILRFHPACGKSMRALVIEVSSDLTSCAFYVNSKKYAPLMDIVCVNVF